MKRFELAALLFLYCQTALSVEQTGITYLDQGRDWKAELRAQYYSTDQGSELIPLEWIAALELDGAPFMKDKLHRYGFFASGNNGSSDLPVGFTSRHTADGERLGMTCAACHTRQITYEGTTYRIDGGPSFIDFYRFLNDLRSAIGITLEDDAAFERFSDRVLGTNGAPEDRRLALRRAMQAWYEPYRTLMDRALPPHPWGMGRSDAVSMIFNRLAGLDIGPPPTRMIPANIERADAPVRFPFLWNAPRQNRTQWTGFAVNGTAARALERNVGQTIGVFARFHPQKDETRADRMDYMKINSIEFASLEKLECLVRKIGPPVWPWAVERSLVDRGRTVFREVCAGCHGVQAADPAGSWDTPVVMVDTDTRASKVLRRNLKDSGVLAPEVRPGDPVKKALTTVIQSSISQFQSIAGAAAVSPQAACSLFEIDPRAELPVRPRAPQRTDNSEEIGRYEARVLTGIWAAAPYLHNGSVPTLNDLLRPVAQRPSEFLVGPDYDPVNVGLAASQGSLHTVMKTTDCGEPDSGNSRCGHEYWPLDEEDKKALLEYLKIL